MSLDHVIVFLAMALLVTLSPGPDILTVITRSVPRGTRAGLVATAGFATGLIVHTTAAAVGLSLIIRNSPTAFHVIKYAGAAYLLYLAARMALAKDAPLIVAGAVENRRLWRIYGQSVLMNVLNPKVTIFFFVFLSGFAEPDSALPVPWQMVIFGALFAACTLLCFGACAIAAGSLAGFLRQSPAAAKWMHRAAAGVFVVLAAWLVIA